MNTISAPVGQPVIVYTWVDSPMIVALVFALAGACFVCIYFLRRRKK